MIEYIYTNGCSWTAGDGLEKDPTFDEYQSLIEAGLDKTTILKSRAWPAALGKKMGLPIVNEAIGGGSNDRAVRMVLDFILPLTPKERSKVLVIIGWTTLERGEVYLEGFKPQYYRLNAAQPFDTYDVSALPKSKVVSIEKMRQLNVAHVYSEIAAHIKFAQQIFMLKNTLENLGVPYLFFSSLMFIHREDEEFKTEIARLKSMIDGPNVIPYDQSYWQFLKDRKIQLSSCDHPLLDGVDAWTDFLVQELKKRDYNHV